MLTLTCCQDHILTKNIWFVCLETSYSGDERRCDGCGTNKRTNIEDRVTQPMEAGFRSFAKTLPRLHRLSSHRLLIQLLEPEGKKHKKGGETGNTIMKHYPLPLQYLNKKVDQVQNNLPHLRILKNVKLLTKF